MFDTDPIACDDDPLMDLWGDPIDTGIPSCESLKRETVHKPNRWQRLIAAWKGGN